LAAAEGVPATAPVKALSDRPDGSDPLVSVHLYGEVPPLAVNVAAYAFPTVPAGSPVVVMLTGVGEGGGFCGGVDGEVGGEGGGEDAFPDGGSVLL